VGAAMPSIPLRWRLKNGDNALCNISAAGYPATPDSWSFAKEEITVFH